MAWVVVEVANHNRRGLKSFPLKEEAEGYKSRLPAREGVRYAIEQHDDPIEPVNYPPPDDEGT